MHRQTCGAPVTRAHLVRETAKRAATVQAMPQGEK
jgi:hypothetical protein